MRFARLRRTAITIGLAICATCVVWVGGRKLVAQRLAPQALTVKYIQTETREFDGAVVLATERHLAVRSDGSRVEPRSVVADDRRAYDQRIIADVAKGKRIVVEGVTQSLTTTILSDMELAALRNPGGRCLYQETEPAEAIFGYRTVKTKFRSPGLHIDSWWAPDLGCVLLKETVSRPHADGTSRLFLTREAVAVTFGEPDPALFEIPDWPESTPSQVFERYRQKFNLPDTEDLGRVKASKDRAYWAQQTKKP